MGGARDDCSAFLPTFSRPAVGDNVDYEIYPLAYTQVDWRIFIDTCQSVLGVSPSRGIDNSYIDIKDPAAYLGSLDLENDPLNGLRNHNCAEHFSMTFILKTDQEGLLALQRYTTLTVHSKEASKTSYLAIVTGTMADWVSAITRCEEPYPLRWIMTRVHAYLQQSGFRELFSEFKKRDLGDGTATFTR